MANSETCLFPCRNIWSLKYVPTRRNGRNFYGLSTIKRRRTFETNKKKLWNAPRWHELFIGDLLPDTPCDQEIRVPGRWKNNTRYRFSAAWTIYLYMESCFGSISSWVTNWAMTLISIFSLRLKHYLHQISPWSGIGNDDFDTNVCGHVGAVEFSRISRRDRVG